VQDEVLPASALRRYWSDGRRASEKSRASTARGAPRRSVA
jgi:hypothetical protein